MSYFTFYKPIFMIELLVIEFIFTFRLAKRKYFALRYVALDALCLTFSVVLPVQPKNAVMLSSVFLAMFAVTFATHLFCYKVSALNLLFCLISAYTVQHFAYCLSNGMMLLTGLNNDVYGVYTEEAVMQLTATDVFGGIFTFVIYYLSYYAFFIVFANRIKKNRELRLKNMPLLIISALAIVISIFVNSAVVYGKTDKTLMTTISIYNALCCCFIIFMLFSMLSNVEMANELDAINKILREAQEQYVKSKKNIELINIKCHDLKHQVREIGRASHINESAITELEHVISIYDSEVNTGNIALDTILTEKSLYCYKNKIRLSCIADGALLAFMSETELYALFGNALDNAISAVKRISDEDKRFIDLVIGKERDFVTVNVHNCYDGELRQTGDDLPRTTKKDETNHGYGLKSIAHIAEKYGGTLSVNGSDGVFNLNIMFPL